MPDPIEDIKGEKPVLTNGQTLALLNQAWKPMHDEDVHVIARSYETDGEASIVVVARGQAAEMLRAFVRDEVPEFKPTPSS